MFREQGKKASEGVTKGMVLFVTFFGAEKSRAAVGETCSRSVLFQLKNDKRTVLFVTNF